MKDGILYVENLEVFLYRFKKGFNVVLNEERVGVEIDKLEFVCESRESR